MAQSRVSKDKAITYAEQSDFAFQAIAKATSLETPISLDELMTYSITSVPSALGTPDGFFAKTNKATIVHHLSDEYLAPRPPEEEVFHIEDGNAVFHAMTNIPGTFKGIALKLLDQSAKKKSMIFSTDSYHENSPKAHELRRRSGPTQLPPIVLSGENMKRPADFKLFMTVDENKISMCKTILKVWSSSEAAKKLMNRDVYLVVEGHLYHFTSDGEEVTVVEEEDYLTTHEETDHKIILYLKLISNLLTNNQQKNKVIIRSPDSDVFIKLLYYSHYYQELTLIMDTGTGDSRRLIDVSELARDKGKDLCKSIPGFYVFTGEDTTSAFKGKGKVQPFKKLLTYPRYSLFVNSIKC